MARFTSAGSAGSANTGDITFDGVEIIGAGTAGEGGHSTIDLVPDADLKANDQYLILDPTSPNHIHIRAGGDIDESNGVLILGGERNSIQVSDGGRNVNIITRPAQVINTYTNTNPTSNTNFTVSNTANIYVGDTVFYPGGDVLTVDSVTTDSPSAGTQTVTANLNGTPGQFVGGAAHVFTHEEPWDYQWTFGNDGVLSGPAMGGLWVEAISKKSEVYGLGIYSPVDVVINGTNGEFLNDSSIPNNQIATLGDLPTGATGSFVSQDNKTITVTDGIITAIDVNP